MQYTETFSAVKIEKLHWKNDIFNNFAHSIDSGYTLELPHCLVEVVLTSTHNLCFRTQIANIYLPQFNYKDLRW